MNKVELIQPSFTITYPDDIEENETIHDYAMRKQIEAEASRERIDALRQGIAKIAMQADNKLGIVDTCSELLSNI